MYERLEVLDHRCREYVSIDLTVHQLGGSVKPNSWANVNGIQAWPQRGVSNYGSLGAAFIAVKCILFSFV